jgi:pimeloyl-ACP methyl ester carboxylesterase
MLFQQNSAAAPATDPRRPMKTSNPSNRPSMHVVEFGTGPCELVWAHGWGHSHKNLQPVAEGLGNEYHHYLLDLPGFGATSRPAEPWGTIEYAEFVADWLMAQPRRPRLWIGHSFGCRVGIRLACRHPELLDGLVLIAAAGLPVRRPPLERMKRGLRKRIFSLLKALAGTEATREKLRQRWGSADYRNAGPLRATFVKVVNENLADDAARISLPVLLIYGEADAETPVSVGQAFARLMPNAKLQVLQRYGHVDILANGRFQLQSRIHDFAKAIWK